MTCTLDVHHAVLSATLRRALAKCQRPATGSAASGAPGPPRAAGGGERRSSAPAARLGSRLPSHERRKMQTSVTGVRWAVKGKTDWGVVGGEHK
jgi:hypothetical protein